MIFWAFVMVITKAVGYYLIQILTLLINFQKMCTFFF